MRRNQQMYKSRHVEIPSNLFNPRIHRTNMPRQVLGRLSRKTSIKHIHVVRDVFRVMKTALYQQHTPYGAVLYDLCEPAKQAIADIYGTASFKDLLKLNNISVMQTSMRADCMKKFFKSCATTVRLTYLAMASENYRQKVFPDIATYARNKAALYTLEDVYNKTGCFLTAIHLITFRTRYDKFVCDELDELETLIEAIQRDHSQMLKFEELEDCLTRVAGKLDNLWRINTRGCRNGLDQYESATSIFS